MSLGIMSIERKVEEESYKIAVYAASKFENMILHEDAKTPMEDIANRYHAEVQKKKDAADAIRKNLLQNYSCTPAYIAVLDAEVYKEVEQNACKVKNCPLCLGIRTTPSPASSEEDVVGEVEPTHR